MHYDTWPHACYILHSKVRHQSRGAAVEQGPAAWFPAKEEPRQVSCRVSTACLSHSTHSPLESSARVSPTPDVGFLSPTAQISSKCFPSLLLSTQHCSVNSCTGLVPTSENWSWCLDSCTGREIEHSIPSTFPTAFVNFKGASSPTSSLPPHRLFLSFPVRRSLCFTFSGTDTATEYLSLIIQIFSHHTFLEQEDKSNAEWRVQLDHSYGTLVLFCCWLFIPFLISPWNPFLFSDSCWTVSWHFPGVLCDKTQGLTL